MPTWCDMECPDAAWPEEEGLDGSGSCRTFLAVYCQKHKQWNKKNALCLDNNPRISRKKFSRKKSAPPLKIVSRNASKGLRIKR
ncbi:MAG: hypothetical protein HPY51_08915 [Candidatus Omnitrophica bacterium]|nr:hypothetical protein [Candidatus Omnitrophota bacterium]